MYHSRNESNSVSRQRDPIKASSGVNVVTPRPKQLAESMKGSLLLNLSCAWICSMLCGSRGREDEIVQDPVRENLP